VSERALLAAIAITCIGLLSKDYCQAIERGTWHDCERRQPCFPERSARPERRNGCCFWILKSHNTVNEERRWRWELM